MENKNLDNIEDPKIENILTKVDTVCLFTPTLNILVQLINSPSTSVKDLVDHIDPAVASEILRIANSAYYSAGRFSKVTTLDRAILMLGFDTVSGIVFEMFLFSLQPDTDFDTKAYVQHSILTAIIAKEIALFYKHYNPDELYLAGLLHDIGKPVIHKYFEKNQTFLEKKPLEKENFINKNHAIIGQTLLQIWKFPTNIAKAIGIHHQEAKDTYSKIIQIANTKAKDIKIPFDVFKTNKPFVPTLKSFCTNTIDSIKKNWLQIL